MKNSDIDGAPGPRRARPVGSARLVIFDLDGTLVDSEPNHLAAEARMLAEVGVPGFDAEAKRPYIGLSTHEILERLIARYSLDQSPQSLAERKEAYYLELARANTLVFPAMRELLELLPARGVRTALASGSSQAVIDAVLTATGLAAAFESTASAEAVGVGKPDPALFLFVAAGLGVDPAHCVVVEDAAPGREAARRAGMRCIYVPPVLDDPAFTPATAAASPHRELVIAGMGSLDPRAAADWIAPLTP